MPFLISKVKKGERIFDQPKNSNPANKNQASVGRRYVRKIRNNFIHDSRVSIKNTDFLDTMTF